MKMETVKIQKSEHVLIAGRTGTGKTLLARAYLAGYDYVTVLDTKGTFTWPEIPSTKWEGYSLVEGGDNLSLITHLTDLSKAKTHKIIYRPSFEEMTLEFYNSFYRWCYERKNNTVYTDELMSVCENPQKYPEYLKAIMTRGRELNVSHWGATQRPSGIAVICISEASHFFVFDLNVRDDRKRLVDITGCTEFEEKPSTDYGKYAFWYYNVDKEQAFPAKLIYK